MRTSFIKSDQGWHSPSLNFNTLEARLTLFFGTLCALTSIADLVFKKAILEKGIQIAQCGFGNVL